jgi:phosphatidylglycerophosphatase A
MNRWTVRAVHAAASCGFLSYVPSKLNPSKSYSTGSGFIGTCVGLLTIRALPLGGSACWAVLFGALFFSVGVSDYAEESMRHLDDPRIIIDEWVGYWVSVAFLPRTWGYLIAAFVLFRIFDVWKPAGIRSLSRLHGGWGVVLDDIAAGVVTNVLLQVFLWIHGRPV